MRLRIHHLILLVLTLALTGCYKCYECSVYTEFGEVTRDVCGRKKDVAALITELESDTVGNGPWTCE